MGKPKLREINANQTDLVIGVNKDDSHEAKAIRVRGQRKDEPWLRAENLSGPGCSLIQRIQEGGGLVSVSGDADDDGPLVEEAAEMELVKNLGEDLAPVP